MNLAPSIGALNGTLVRMPDGLAGIASTTVAMRRLVRVGKTDPNIIDAAVSLTYLTPERDDYAAVAALHAFVRDSVRYVRDVAGVETLCDPRVTLTRLVGDCDDQVMLLCSLCEAIGYPSRFVVAGYGAPGVPEHVYCQINVAGADGGEEWIDADPTEPQPLGWFPPGAVYMQVERV